MAKTSDKYLYDAANAGALVQQFTAGKSYQDYLSDVLLRSAVERQLGIVGEALNDLSKFFPETAEKIPELRRIVDFRIVVVHNYDGINHETVWGIVTTRLPELNTAVNQLLSDTLQ